MRDDAIAERPATGVLLRFLRVDGLSPGAALSARERAVHEAFRIEKRKKEWLAGRLAAKELLSRLTGVADLSVFEIGMDESGRPASGGTLLSISHSGGWALAAARAGASFLGADIERIEERHPAWYRDYFHPAELPSPDPSEATRLWTAKEAMMKALGMGLAADPLSMLVTGGTIKLHSRALRRYGELGSPPFVLETFAYPEGFWTAVVSGSKEKA